ncbi:MAG TPA: 50S ribosomal protein L25 [Oculatellaceae cyanobacterium]
MEKIKLAVKEREAKKPNQLRREGAIPATLYGPGQPAQSVQVDAREFSRLPDAAHSHMIELTVGGKGTNAIIRNVQRRATTHQVLNVEFYRVAMDRKLTLTVPLKFVGSSPAVANGNQLVELFQEAEIECFPAEIPDTLEVDLGKLVEVDDAIHFSDIKLPKGVEILNPHDEIVAKAVTPRTMAEPEEAAPAAAEAAPAAEPAAAEASA